MIHLFYENLCVELQRSNQLCKLIQETSRGHNCIKTTALCEGGGGGVGGAGVCAVVDVGMAVACLSITPLLFY